MNVNKESHYPNYYPNSLEGPKPETCFKAPSIDVKR